ncbi:MAG: ribonuclease HI family protein [Oligoflexia bacterium]|nr:ribonuclease HI family protein [Oligoflexia bacterium]
MGPQAKLPHEVIVYTDGASRGNPGPASAGVAIFSADGKLLEEISLKLGNQTNNFAEYTALIEALKACAAGGAKVLMVRADSQFMIRQMQGLYKVKAEGIIPLYQQCKKLTAHFEVIKFEHIPREQNVHADRLANKALDS